MHCALDSKLILQRPIYRYTSLGILIVICIHLVIRPPKNIYSHTWIIDLGCIYNLYVYILPVGVAGLKFVLICLGHVREVKWARASRALKCICSH